MAIAQQRECTKCCRIVHFKMVNSVLCDFHPNKLTFKKEKESLFQAEKLAWDEILPGTEA